MKQNLAHVAIVVDDYDKAIEFYTKKLHFTLVEDTILSDSKRWVLVRPKGASECSLLLAKSANDEQKSRIGNQTGGRVFLFLNTDNFEYDYQNLIDNNVKIVSEPRDEDYGKVAVFEDLYGNLWDLIGSKLTRTYFYTTSILKIKDASKIDFTILELQKLKCETLKESGNISLEIQQFRDQVSKIMLLGCFKDEQSYNEYLLSKNMQIFIKLDLVEFEIVYFTKNVD